jgi:transposase InsO family protein
MRRMGIEALCRQPNTSNPAPGQKIYPYLLRGLVVDRPNQVWARDIIDIAMARGFVYLAAVVDWFGRSGSGVAAVDHAGDGVLPRRWGGGAGPACQARDFQHRSGQPIHQHSVHRDVAGPEDRDLHGLPWRLA